MDEIMGYHPSNQKDFIQNRRKGLLAAAVELIPCCSDVYYWFRMKIILFS
jgi:hypothetical protein